jgi:hypothetical protein
MMRDILIPSLDHLNQAFAATSRAMQVVAQVNHA